MVAETGGEISGKFREASGNVRDQAGGGMQSWILCFQLLLASLGSTGRWICALVGISSSLISDLGAELSCQLCFCDECLEQTSLPGLPGNLHLLCLPRHNLCVFLANHHNLNPQTSWNPNPQARMDSAHGNLVVVVSAFLASCKGGVRSFS